MKLLKNAVAILLIATIISTLVVVPTSIAANNVTVTVNGTKNYDKANEILEQTNQERANAAVGELTLDKSLCDYAMMRAAEISTYFSHTRPNGRIILYDFSSSGIHIDGENIAAGSSSSAGAMEQWMTSEGHRENILTSAFNSIGIGSYTSSGTTWWVQVFSYTNAKEVSTYTGTTSSTDTITVSPDEAPIALSITGLKDTNTINIGDTIAPTGVKMQNNRWPIVSAQIQLSDIDWKSSDTDIFTVDEKGTITGVSAGTATLTASLGNYSKKYTITVAPEKAIELNKTTASLWVGETDTLKVTYIPEDSDQGDISWESSNKDVVTVKDGKITAVSKGTADITATASKSGKTATCKVTVKQPYTGMTLSDDSITLDKSKIAELKVTTIPEQADEDATITFESLDESVATVDKNGIITGVNSGTTQIKVTMTTSSTKKTYEDFCDITVNAHIEGIDITNGDLTLYKDQTEALNVEFRPAEFVDSKALEWTSSDEDVAIVTQDDKGNTIVKAIAPGTAEITAKTVNGLTDTIMVTVPTVEIETLTLNKNKTSIEKGETEELTATILPENTTEDTTITWSSSDNSIATVDKNGLITAVTPGTVKITAATVSGLTDECEVTVTSTLKSISINSEKENLVINGNKETVQLTVSKNPEDADPSIDDVNWSSGDESIATVDENGLVTAIAPGTAIITATLNGKTANCTVTVDVALKSVAIENQDKTLELVKNQTGNLNVILNPENTTIIPTATWTSSNESVATVDQEGKVTAVAPGDATITVDYGNNITASRDVKVTEILADSIKITNVVESLLVNKGTTLGVTLNPIDATDNISWSSSDESILKVDEKGNVTPIKAGTATITVTTETGLTDSIEIKVEEKHLESITVIPENDTLVEGENTIIEIKLNPTDITDTIESIDYEIVDPTMAFMGENGYITVLKAGEVIVNVSVSARQGDGTINTVTSQLKLNVAEAPEQGGETEEPGDSDETENTDNKNNTENTGNNTDDSQIKGEENTGKDESKISENVEALTTSPHTGDMNIVALIALMIISLIGMVIIVKKK